MVDSVENSEEENGEEENGKEENREEENSNMVATATDVTDRVGATPS